MQQDFQDADVSSGNGGSGGRGGDVGSHNTSTNIDNSTENDQSTYMNRCKSYVYDFVSGFKSSGNVGSTIIHNGGNTISYNQSKSFSDSSITTHNDSSIRNIYSPILSPQDDGFSALARLPTSFSTLSSSPPYSPAVDSAIKVTPQIPTGDRPNYNLQTPPVLECVDTIPTLVAPTSQALAISLPDVEECNHKSSASALPTSCEHTNKVCIPKVSTPQALAMLPSAPVNTSALASTTTLSGMDLQFNDIDEPGSNECTADSRIITAQSPSSHSVGINPVIQNDPTKFDVDIQNFFVTPMARTEVDKSIDSLKDSVASIEIYFRDVIRNLLNAEGTYSHIHHDMSLFREELSRYQEHFINLLWQSRVVAGQGRVIANNFVRVFIVMLQNTEVSLDSKRAELAAYKQRLHKDMSKAQELSSSFSRLQSDITRFHVRLCLWMDNHGIARLDKKAQDVLGKIEKTQKATSLIQQKVVANAPSSYGFEVAEGTYFFDSTFMGIVCPGFLIASAKHAMIKGGDLLSTLQALEAHQRVLWEKEAESNAVRRNQHSLSLIKSALVLLEADMALVSIKLPFLAQVWNMIYVDLTVFEEKVFSANLGDAEGLFRGPLAIRLTTIRGFYALLSSALYRYEINTHIEKARRA